MRAYGCARALRTCSCASVLKVMIHGRHGGRQAYLGLANMAMANIAVRQKYHALEHQTQTSAIKSIVGFLKLALEGRTMSGIRFRAYDVLYALQSLCECHERDLIGIECMLVDVVVQAMADLASGATRQLTVLSVDGGQTDQLVSTLCSDTKETEEKVEKAKAITHPVLELSADILMHLAHSEQCKQRMRDLHLECTINKLMHETGSERDHLLEVLYVVRDRDTMLESAKQIVAHVKVLQSVSEYHNWNSKGNHLTLGLQEIMHQAEVSEDMHGAWTWLRDSLQYADGAFWTTSTCSNCTSDKTKVSHMDGMIASKDIEIEDLKNRLAATEKQHEELEQTYIDLKAEHDKCPDLIAALRRQIKETKDALELDDSTLENLTVKVHVESAYLKEQLRARIKLAAAPPNEARVGQVRLGAGAPPRGVGEALPVLLTTSGGKLAEPGLKFEAMDMDGDGVLSKEELQSKLRNMRWSLEEAAQTFAAMDRDGDGGISANEFAAFCQMQDKRLEAGTLSGIAKLRSELAVMRKALAPKPVEIIVTLGLDFWFVLYRMCFLVWKCI